MILYYPFRTALDTSVLPGCDAFKCSILVLILFVMFAPFLLTSQQNIIFNFFKKDVNISLSIQFISHLFLQRDQSGVHGVFFIKSSTTTLRRRWGWDWPRKVTTEWAPLAAWLKCTRTQETRVHIPHLPIKFTGYDLGCQSLSAQPTFAGLLWG